MIFTSHVISQLIKFRQHLERWSPCRGWRKQQLKVRFKQQHHIKVVLSSKCNRSSLHMQIHMARLKKANQILKQILMVITLMECNQLNTVLRNNNMALHPSSMGLSLNNMALRPSSMGLSLNSTVLSPSSMVLSLNSTVLNLNSMVLNPCSTANRIHKIKLFLSKTIQTNQHHMTPDSPHPSS